MGISTWTRKHTGILGAIFFAVAFIVLVIDLWMVQFLDVDSISRRVWFACDGHPAIRVCGMILTGVVCWLLRGWWFACASAAGIGFHLYTH